jgi:hypothetical protein
MVPSPHSLEDLQERLLKLEKQNRRFKQLGVAALIVPTLVLILGQASSKKTVEANEFLLRDDSGNVRWSLAVNPARAHGSPEMFFFDEKRNPRLKLDGGVGIITDGGGQVTVYDGNGQVRGFFTLGHCQLGSSRTVRRSG